MNGEMYIRYVCVRPPFTVPFRLCGARQQALQFFFNLLPGALYLYSG